MGEKEEKEEKELIRKKLLPHHDKYWTVKLFKEKGFKRQQCPKCKKFFWSLEKRPNCGDVECSGSYGFIGKKITKKSFTYEQSWKAIRDFFIKNNHVPLKSYPTVSRWFPGIYFTIASIAAFQRKTGDKTVFEFPFNPLIIPQFCLRFPDIESVGITGRHMTSFVMFGQHSLYNPKKPVKGSYWKDRCIELDYKLLTEVFGISPKEISFVEDVWLGEGAFGYSLEYFVGGLELGNAVFTEFVGSIQDYEVMKEKIIDMGAGLERFAWLSQGTETAYNAVYPQIEKFKKQAKSKEALQAIYAIFDHVRTLLLAINDNALPSNVGGGYNLRVILRRCWNFIDQHKLEIDLIDLAKAHASALNKTEILHQDLTKSIPQFEKILNIEKQRYEETKKRSSAIISKLIHEKKKLSTQELLTLYESQGISPEFLQQQAKNKLKITIPKNFYQLLLAKREKEKEKQEKEYDLKGIPETTILFYEPKSMTKFSAKVLKSFDNNKVLVLDKTAFYPESGGQETDLGTINNIPVLYAEKQNNIILHFLSQPLKEKTVMGEINLSRRKQLSQHHSATHIVNYACRKVLGEHVWQAGAHKSEDIARLDITHWANLSKQEIAEIERESNQIIKKTLPIKKEILPRQSAEKKYGFRIYQGGAVPSPQLRIISIDNLDSEACGGTHLNNTSEAERIKIINSERIADGVTRINFVAGFAAKAFEQKKSLFLEQAASAIGVEKHQLPDAAAQLFSKWKKAKKLLKKVKQNKQITAQELSELELKPSALDSLITDEELLSQTLAIFNTQAEYLPKNLERFHKELHQMKEHLCKALRIK